MQTTDFGRFEQSFVFHMIRDFFLLLIVVTSIEMGVRYAVVIYEFEHHDRQMVDLAATRLAADVKSIMLNSGGPVAARTVYPILKRNFEDLGLSISIIPSAVTVSSMQDRFGMEPRGIPPQWPQGQHNESKVILTAEQFCLNCHAHAKIGEVLGEVTVRGYLSTRLSAWWAELRLTSIIWAVNIITHTIVLLLLLRIRMEPLLSLRATVARLAKGVINLSHRSKLNSHDEFGELANDLNQFLDRITQVVEDLDRILNRVVTVGHRLSQVSTQMDAQFAKIHGAVQATLNDAFVGSEGADTGLRDELLGISAVLDGLIGETGISAPDKNRLHALVDRLQALLPVAERLASGSPKNVGLLGTLSREVHGYGHFFGEMALLEQKMQAVAESGQELLSRLTQDGTNGADDASAVGRRDEFDAEGTKEPGQTSKP